MTMTALAGELPARPMPAELLTLADAAALCAVGERSLWRWSRSGLAPAPVRIGRAVRFRRRDLLAWLDAGCPRVDGRAV